MRIHPGRILGALMGLVILVAVFLLPFTSSQTLYGKAGPLLSNLGAVQQLGDFASVATDYVLVVVFVLLVIAGLVGIFPLGTGVLGVVAMAMVTLASILIHPAQGGSPTYEAGFYVAWVASIISLGASFWHRRGNKTVTVNDPPA
jgi:hypothetical protein